MKSYSFAAELQEEEDGRWSAWIDALPGCAAWGMTRKQAIEALREATEAYVADMIDCAESVPQVPAKQGAFVFTIQV
jgi:predicted RNase H-like HicB family nuclease